MLISIEKLKSLVIYAGEVIETADKCDAFAIVSMAKATAGKTALDVVQDTIQIFAAVGFQWDHPTNFLLRRSLLLRSLFGDSAEHLQQVASRILDTKKSSAEKNDNLTLAIFATESSGGKHDNIEVFQ